MTHFLTTQRSVCAPPNAISIAHCYYYAFHSCLVQQLLSFLRWIIIGSILYAHGGQNGINTMIYLYSVNNKWQCEDTSSVCNQFVTITSSNWTHSPTGSPITPVPT
eukprot:1074716_1